MSAPNTPAWRHTSNFCLPTTSLAPRVEILLRLCRRYDRPRRPPAQLRKSSLWRDYKSTSYPPKNAPQAVYTDGIKLGDPPSSGAAAVLRDDRIAVCRAPGAPNSYKAELIGILLGSHPSAEGGTLCLDCQGAILSSQGSKPPLCQAHWVRQVRSSPLQKEQSLEWVERLVGHQYNELSNHYAEVGSLHPPPPPATGTSLWEVIRQGEVTLSPHKVHTTWSPPTSMSTSIRYRGNLSSNTASHCTSGCLDYNPKRASATVPRIGAKSPPVRPVRTVEPGIMTAYTVYWPIACPHTP